MKLTALLFSVLLLTVTVPFYGQRPVSKSKRAVATFATAPLDTTSTQLGPQYGGVDPEILYNELERRSKERKGEFETTAAFNARIVKLESSPLVGAITRESPIALALSTGAGLLDSAKSRYVADRGVLVISLETTAAVIGIKADMDKRSLRLRRVFHPSKTYIGQNAYGAKVAVEETFVDMFELIVENFNEFERRGARGSLTYQRIITAEIPMTAAEAMTVKPNLRVLALVKLVNPYFLTGYITQKPTISKPRDTFVVYQYLVGNVYEFWIYDYASGRIYAKWRPPK
jgi:hypothetical protein